MKNKGMFLESLLNKTISFYEKNMIGMFHKKPIPINFNSVKKGREVNQAWIASKSTVDYYGIYKGIFIAFEAKSTRLKSLPLVNIKYHQIDYLNKVNTLGGLGFFVIYYDTYDEYFLLLPGDLEGLDQKSLNIDVARKKGYSLEVMYPGILDFASVLDNLL